MQDAVYDGFSFAANGIVLTNIDHLQVAERINQTEKIANRDGMVLVQSQLGSKPILLEGYYIGPAIAATQLMYDTLTQVLNREERILTVPHGGGTRSYTATPSNIVISQPDGLNRLTFSLQFLVPSGNSVEATAIALMSPVTVTTANSSIPLTVIGSVSARPLITLTYTAITGGTGKTITVRNARDFIGLTFTGNFVTGDVITIDSDKFQIYKNGVLQAPSGRMPTWASGPGSLYYSDTFTSRSVTISATYIPKNL